MKDYFVTLTVECMGNRFPARSDAEAIETVRKAVNQITDREETVREICIHRIDKEKAVPVYSRNLVFGSTASIPVSEGQTAISYNLGLPLTIRTSLGRETEVSQDKSWPSQAEETGIHAEDRRRAQEAFIEAARRVFGETDDHH